MSSSLLGLNIFKGLVEMIRDMFDIIPKTIYFIYACLASCVDALQSLIRKLAGLDVYYITRGSSMNDWVGGNGLHSETAYAQQDPLTEFIKGILGYGDNKEVYRGLNTVFWSLAIFAVIMLVITTMIAIIKSHYNEDTAGTSPWKFIYQAIKAMLTFIAIPAVVLLGMRLNTFVLSTLDKITAGSGNEEQITTIYGSDGPIIFEKGEIAGTELETYVSYDYFGFGSYTTFTPFSGMLFKAAAYNCNRARTGDVRYQQYQNIDTHGTRQIFGSGSCSAFTQLTTDLDKQEYVAYQIDYAFANNLTLDNVIYYPELMDATDCSVTGLFDILGVMKTIKHFTKFSPAVVWQFYNLWSFNYIIGFAGVFAVFSIMLSIVVGLMSRLIKGAALFLIYPALLGLAPLDNFKAFKSWGTTFMQQVLMAVGSIIGLNLLMLILPYATSIKFYGIGLLDAIINVVILCVGLAMAKDFISMVSGFASGADALSVGGGLKSEATASLKKGASMTAKVGMGTIRAGAAGIGKIIQHNRRRHAADDANRARNRAEALRPRADDLRNEANDKQTEKNQALTNAALSGTRAAQELSDVGNKARLEYMNANKDKGISADELSAGADKAEFEAMEAHVKNKGFAEFGADGVRLQKAFADFNDADARANKAEADYQKQKDKEKAIVDKYNVKVDGNGNYRDMTAVERAQLKQTAKDNGETAGARAKALFESLKDQLNNGIDGVKLGKTVADSFVKTVKEMGSGMGFDKAVSGVKGIFSGTMKFDGTGWPNEGVKKDVNKLSGDDLARRNAEDLQKKQEQTNELIKKQIEASQATTDAVKDLAKRIGGTGGGSSRP